MSDIGGYRCPLCAWEGAAARITAREMMIGLRTEFEYAVCGECGSLRILSLPEDLSRYYPADYYSFTAPVEYVRNPLKRLAKAAWLRDRLGEFCLLGRLLRNRIATPPFLDWVRRTGIRQTHAILDVGCGSGALLAYLHGFGFKRLTGCDPYLPVDSAPAPGLAIRSCALEQIEGSYDLVIFNHSLEHIPDPESALAHARTLLSPGGWVLVRVPLADSAAYREYGIDWVQFDAPRHLTLFTRTGIAALAARNGLTLGESVDDSTAFQFWGSEQYRRDIPLLSERSWLKSPGQSIFSPAQIDEFTRLAAGLNGEGRGDQACFYLRFA